MPLFECSQCHTVDNTATANYWARVHMDQKPALCSACDPDLGTWHDRFPRTTLEEYHRLYPDAKPVEYTIENNYGQPPVQGKQCPP